MDAAPRRLGPLTAVPAPAALAVGDVAARSVRLTSTAVERWSAAEKRDEVPWAEVAELAVDLPVTLSPSPTIGDTVVPVILGIFGDAHTPTPERAWVTVVDRDGRQRRWEIDGHHVSGYRRRHVRSATALTARLLEDPSARVLLAMPGELLARIDDLARPL
jgi:hypothetical protein